MTSHKFFWSGFCNIIALKCLCDIITLIPCEIVFFSTFLKKKYVFRHFLRQIVCFTTPAPPGKILPSPGKSLRKTTSLKSFLSRQEIWAVHSCSHSYIKLFFFIDCQSSIPNWKYPISRCLKIHTERCNSLITVSI